METKRYGHTLLKPFALFCCLALFGEADAQTGSPKPIPESEFYFLEISGADSSEVMDYFNFTAYENPYGKIFIPSLGPMLLFVKGFEFIHRPEDGNKIEIKKDEHFLYVNEKLRAMKATASPEFLRRLKAIKREDVSRLDVVFIDSIPAEAYSHISRLIDYKPDLSLMFNKSKKTNQSILANTSPRILILGDGNLPNGMDLNNVEFLIVGADSLFYAYPELKGKISMMNALRSLIIVSYKNFSDSDMEVFSKCRNLRGITILDNKIYRFGFLENHPELEKLLLGIYGDTKNHIKNLPKLKWLHIASDSIVIINKFDHLRNLTVLGLIEGNYSLTRKDIQDIASYNPNLRYLDVRSIKNFPTLSPLVQLNNLEGISIDTTVNVEEFAQMKKLKYVGINNIDFDTEIKKKEALEKIRKIKTYCPSCLVNEVDLDLGLCLGSGWILLFFPVLVFVVFFYRGFGHQSGGAS